MRSIRHAMQFAAVVLVSSFIVSPVQAVTCDEARSMSATALSNWAKRLNVSRASLAILLEQSFCQVKKPAGVIVSDRMTNGSARKPKSS